MVGFAGRFVEEKGFDFLLQAIPFVRRSPSARFVFAGDTHIAYERFFERSLPFLEPVREAVIELGLVGDPRRMADFYAMCDVFVLPSRTDCFAIVQVEALLSGTPLVTSDIPGAREVVRVTGAGTLVPPGDSPALADGSSGCSRTRRVIGRIRRRSARRSIPFGRLIGTTGCCVASSARARGRVGGRA